MKRQQRVGTRITLAVVIAATIARGTCLSQEFVLPEPVAGPAADYGPFSVGGSERKSLPPVDCLHCFGPAPCMPCDSHHQGFLFYGTYPWDDDCVNGFDDCVRGDCGQVAAGISRAWIRLHERCWWPFRRSHCKSSECCGVK